MDLTVCCEVKELAQPLSDLGVQHLLLSLSSSKNVDVLIQNFDPSVNSSAKVSRILVKRSWSPSEILLAKRNQQVLGIIDLEMPAREINQSLKRLLEEIEQQILKESALKEERDRNKILSSENVKLNEQWLKLVSEKKTSLQNCKVQGRQLQERVFFLKRLNEAVEFSEVLSIVREESKLVRGLGDPILMIRQKGRSQILFFNNRVIAEKRTEIEDSSLEQWRQDLANLLGRPVGPLLRVESSDATVLLLFEHQLDRSDFLQVEKDWAEWIEAVSVAIERLKLDQDLREASFFWEKTFDGLDEPIGILDPSNRLIRANRSLTPELLSDLDKEIVRKKGRVYHLQKFPISFGENRENSAISSSKVVHFSDQTTQFQLKQHMIQTEKIAALGQLAGHIAHELNNPLTGIRSLCQLLMTDEKVPTQQLEDLREVERASERCQKIITNLLEYSNPNSSGHAQLTEVNEVIHNTLPFLKTLMGSFHREIELSDEPLWAVIDPHLLQQVVFNIIANACYAMGKKGSLTLRSHRKGDFVEIEIQDSGPGVPEDIREQIFDPFFTTKPKGEGTGLGLSFSRNFLRTCGGELLLKLPKEGGSLFVIQLPYRTDKI